MRVIDDYDGDKWEHYNEYYLLYSLNYLCHKDTLDVNICLQVLLITCRKVFNGQLTWRDLHCCNLQDKATRGNNEIPNTMVTTCTKSILQPLPYWIHADHFFKPKKLEEYWERHNNYWFGINVNQPELLPCLESIQRELWHLVIGEMKSKY